MPKPVIGKWLKAGVLEKGSLSYPEAGSPQAVAISPLLANVFCTMRWTRGSGRSNRVCGGRAATSSATRTTS